MEPGPVQLPVDTPLGATADVAFDRIAAVVRKVLHVPVALVSLVDQDGQVFPGQSGLPSPWSETRCTPLTHSFCQYVVKSAAPLVVSDARNDDVLKTNLAIVDINVIAYAGVPLMDSRGTVVGSLCAIDTKPREWTETDLGLLRDLSAACSSELELKATAIAARDAEILSSALLELSETLSDTLTFAQISQAVSKLATGRLGAAFGGITILDPLRETLTYVDLDALPGSAQVQYRELRLSDDLPSPAAAREHRPFFFESISQMRAQFPEAARALEDAHAGAAVYLPLMMTDRVVGTAGILWARPREFDDADQALLIGLTRYTAQAVERALLLRDRRVVAETLQAAMLPQLPVVDGVELASRYVPARAADAVGGDWYDAFSLPDGLLVVTVGDVQGHDTQAAAVMGQVRSMLRALTITGPENPSTVFDALDGVMTALPLDRFATGVLATVSRSTTGAAVTWTNAGHPPPLITAPEKPSAFLTGAPDRPLGMGLQQGPRQRHTVRLSSGSTMLLFTDGLIERRNTGLDQMLERLRVAADKHRHLELTEMIDKILDDIHSEDRDDDVVVFGLRLTHEGDRNVPPEKPHTAATGWVRRLGAVADRDLMGPPVSLQLPFELGAPSIARRLVDEHVPGLSETLCLDARLLVSEVVTNAVRYGLPVVTMQVERTPDSITVRVTDAGRNIPQLPDGRPDASTPSGRGLLIIDALAQDWGVLPAADGHGKTVWFKLNEPASG